MRPTRTAEDRPLRIAYLAVHDPDYPRNSRIRAWLEGSTTSVSIVVQRKRRRGGRLRRTLSDLRSMRRASAGADVIVVAEFALPYAVAGFLLARARGARLVVDHFVGAHETVIGDFAEHGSASLQAMRHRVVDSLALRVADLALIDTEVRATALRRRCPSTTVLALPVGVAGWTSAVGPRVPDGTRRIMFYGDHLPLHGTGVIVDAVARVTVPDVELVMIGSAGPARSAVEARAQSAAADHAATGAPRWVFLGRQTVTELAASITRCDVVLGVFGTSGKAASVLPNKVWEGLAARRTVITRDTPAAAELTPVVGQQLITVAPEPIALAAALDRALGTSTGPWPDRRAALQSQVDERFDAFERWLNR